MGGIGNAIRWANGQKWGIAPNPGDSINAGLKWFHERFAMHSLKRSIGGGEVKFFFFPNW